MGALELLALMDFTESVDWYKYDRVESELCIHLQRVLDNEHEKVKSVLALAPQYLWDYYKNAGVKGQPEQEILDHARKKCHSAIRKAFKHVRTLQTDREKML